MSASYTPRSFVPDEGAGYKPKSFVADDGEKPDLASAVKTATAAGAKQDEAGIPDRIAAALDPVADVQNAADFVGGRAPRGGIAGAVTDPHMPQADAQPSVDRLRALMGGRTFGFQPAVNAAVEGAAKSFGTNKPFLDAYHEALGPQNAAYDKAESEQPIAAIAGASRMKLPLPSSLEGASGLGPATARVLARVAELVGGSAASAYVRGKPVAPEAAKAAGVALVAGAVGEGIRGGVGVAGKMTDALENRAAELAQASGIPLDKALEVAKGEMSDKAGEALASGAGNMVVGGAKAAAGKAIGGMVPGTGGLAMSLLGLHGGASQLARGAKQLAQGILARPGLVTTLQKVEPFGDAIARAAMGGGAQLASVLFALGRKDPETYQRIQKHLDTPGGDKPSPASYTNGL